MGLFNRNKGDAPDPAAPETGTSPADTGTFDFDAISRDLDAQNGASSFDALLAAPATNASQTADNSAFDFPDDPLGLSTPSQNPAPTTGNVPIATSPESVLNAPMSPTTPTTGLTPREPVAPAPAFTPTETPKAKKSLPLVPLLGALGLLAVAGGGAMFLLNSNQNPEEPIAPMAPPSREIRPAAPPAGVGEGAATVPNTPGVATAPGVPPGAPVGGAPVPVPRSASPGIAPATGPKQPAPVPGASTGINASTGQRPTAPGRGPSATAGLDPALAAKLKQLWKTGAQAKRRGDYKAARAAWTQALKLRPTHPGFQDSINKLPR